MWKESWHIIDHLPLERTPLLSSGKPLSGRRPFRRSWISSYLKVEGPTRRLLWDRGMVLIAKAVEEGSEAVICASTGTRPLRPPPRRRRLRAIVPVPTARLQWQPAIMHGAEVSPFREFHQALDIVRSI